MNKENKKQNKANKSTTKKRNSKQTEKKKQSKSQTPTKTATDCTLCWNEKDRTNIPPSDTNTTQKYYIYNKYT